MTMRTGTAVETPSTVRFEVTPRRVVLSLACCIATLFVTYVALAVMHHSGRRVATLYTLLDVGMDSSIPTWYSSLALLLCATQSALLALVERSEGGGRSRWWMGLASIFLFMSIDEVAMIHERVGMRLAGLILRDSALAASPWLTYSWVIIGVVVAMILVLTFLRFVLGLPTATRNGLILGTAIFLGGALGVESINARRHKLHGVDMVHALGTGLEEFMEMVGVAVMLYALVAYRPFRIQVDPAS